MALPADWPPSAGRDRAQRLIAEVRAGRAEIDWCILDLSDGSATLRVIVSCDALRIGGVRVSADAVTQQIVADELGAVLLTPKLYDQIYLHALPASRLDPKPQPITSSTAGTIAYSSRVDDEVARLGASLPLANVGKAWVITNAIFTPTAISRNRSANYGWILPSRTYQGLTGESSSSTPSLWVVQDVGTAHNAGIDPGSGHDDYCLSPDTRVLTADLRWIPIEHIAVGTEIIAFPEDLKDCKLCSSIVTSKTFVDLDCFAVVTDQGSVYASADHRWVSSRDIPNRKYKDPKRVRKVAKLRTRKEWMRTIDLLPGMYITKYCEPWDIDNSWDGGWLAGFLDGEGWVNPHAVAFGQNPGFLLEHACALLQRDGFVLARQPNKNGCVRVMITGGVPMRALGKYRPYRLMRKSRKLWEGIVPWGGRGRDANARILEIVPCGKRTLVGIGTTTHTLIADGFLTHNSQVILLAHRSARFGELPVDLAEVYTGKAPGNALVSQEGPLADWRYRTPSEVPTAMPPVPVPAGGAAIGPAAASGVGSSIIGGAIGGAAGYALGGAGWGIGGAILGLAAGTLVARRA